MITFYKADETDFDNNGLGVLDHDIQNPDIEEKLNDIFTFSFNYPIFAVNGSRLAARMIVKADDPENEGQLFRIMKLSKSNGMLTAFCYHIFYDLNGNEIPDTNIVGQNGQTAITQMLSKTAVAHKFQGFSDIADIANIRVVRMSPVKFLIDPQTDNNFINRLGGEIRRVNYRIWMNKVRGSDNGATIRWKKSLDSYNATWDYTTIATRIRPVGYNGIMLPESYVDSPLIDKYETIVIKEIQYSDIKAIDPNATSNDETAIPLEQAYELLRQAAAKEFSGNNLDKPTVTLSVNMVALRNMDEYKDVKSLETINPWDTVTVINERDGLSVKVRLNHYHWNPVTRKFISMELGNSKSSFTDIGSKIDHATNLANQANDTANTAAESANGKNSNYYGPSEPSRPVDGDLWYKKNGDKTELWQYDGKSVPPGWKLVVDDATGEEVRQNVDAAQKEAEEAKKQANKAVAAANDAVAKAGFANDTADQAKSDAAAATQNATTALTNAGTALTNAKNALDNVTKLDQTVKTEVTNINGQLAQKVNQTTFDTLKGTVTSQGTLINQNKAEIQLKADLSLVNTIKQTVTNNTSAIDLNSKEIKLKTSQSDVDKLGGRVTNAEAQIKLQADQIKLTVSKTELTNILGDYATETWTQSQIKSTADSINLSVTKVQNNLDNLAIGARNYLADTSTSWQTQGYGVTNQVSLNKWLFTFGTIKQAPFKDGEYVTVSFDYTSVGTGAYGTISPKFNDTPWGQFNDGEAMKDNGHVVRTVQWKSDWTTSGTATGIQIRMDDVATTRTVTVYNMQFERGNKDTDWKQAPEDMATVEKLSELQVTVNGIQGTVQNKADQSQVTQMAGQITSLVASTNNPNLIPNSGLPKDTLFWRVNDTTRFKVTTHAFYTKGSLFALLAPQGTGTAERTAGTAIVSVTRGATYTASLGVFGGSNVVGCDVFWLGRKHGETTDTKVLLLAGNFKPNPSEIEFKSWTFNVGDCDEGYIRIDNNGSTSGESTLYFGEVKLEKGGRYTPWEQTAELSEIVQTREMINLRVQKGDVVNQINISPESILIAGQKVHITGQTSIDNAVIKDAMIANVTADKITAGTLNAANVNVVNLNANNITTGTIKGANLSINLNTGEILFQKGSIKSTNGNLNIDINDGSMAVLNGQDGFYFKDGKLSLSSDWAGNNSFGESNFGSIEYSHSLFGSSGMLVRGNGGLLLGTNKFKENVWVSNVVESGITITPKGVSLQSEGTVSLTAGTKTTDFPIYSPPFILVGTDGDGTGVGNRIQIYAEYVHIPSAYRQTASGSANVIVAADGALVRSTSASKYKTDIIRTNIPDYGEKLLNLPTATWTDIAETKRYRDDPVNQIKPTRNFGMIAEDLAEAGLEMLVVRGTDGELEGINYDRIGPALIPVIAKLKNEVEILKQKIGGKTA